MDFYLLHGLEFLAKSYALRPSSLLVAAESDVSQDLWHLSHCRRAALNGAVLASPSDVLQPSERMRLNDYVQKFSRLPTRACTWQDLVCHLSDAPSTGWTTWSASSGRIPTFRKSGGLLYFPAYERHLLLREMYLAMGYLTFDVSSWPYFTHAYRVFVPGLTWNDMKGALGNSMHVAQVGAFAGCLLLCTRRKADALSLSQLLDICDTEG